MRTLAILLVLTIPEGCVSPDPYRKLASRLAAPFASEPKRVAVLPFRGAGRELEAEGEAAAERLVSRLHGRRGVSLVERTRLHQVLSESSLASTGAIAPDTVKNIGRLTGADAIVVGTIFRGADALLDVEARVVETETGRILSAGNALLKAGPVDAPTPAKEDFRATRIEPAATVARRDLGPGDRLPWRLGGFGTAITAGRLYVIGGQKAAGAPLGVRDVISAPILADGRLGAWREETPLPEGRYQVAGAASSGYLFAIGGFHSSLRGEIFSARVGSDGTLGFWRQAGSLPTPGTACSAAADRGVLAVSGCATASGADRRVFTAILSGDGSLRSPASIQTPEIQRHPALAFYEGRLYLLGGDNDGAPRKDAVYSVEIGQSGEIGSFRLEAPLPRPVMHAGAATFGERLWVVGGLDAAARGEVFSAGFVREGRLFDWRTERRRLDPPSVPMAMPSWRGRGYVIAGDTGHERIIMIPDDLR